MDNFNKQETLTYLMVSVIMLIISIYGISTTCADMFFFSGIHVCTMDNFNKQETLTYLMVSVIMLIISIYGISTTCADMFLTVILKFCIIGIEVKLDAKNL
ncbi:hypothetical protein DXC08_13445 [Clostridium sp. OM07-9AC]|nr:hypothetical protein DXC08_13445 [Clostridium sp. OM07-9AC]